MLFNSTAYLLFLPLVFLLYWSVPHKWRNALLVAASFVFYGWWDVRFLGLMIATCLVNYLLALAMGEKNGHSPGNRRRKLLCALAILTNFAILGVFKYFNFFAATLAEACATFGWQLHFPVLHILLPVGISFYTFQVTGYIIDVYRGSLPPERSATPTAAADDICIGYDRCRKAIPEVRMRISAALRVGTERKRAIFSRCDRGRLTELLERRLQGEAQRLDFNRARLPMLVRAVAENARRRLEINRLRLEKESPTVILSKGYALVFDENGRPVTRAAALPPESRVTLQFTDGRRSARITEETIP